MSDSVWPQRRQPTRLPCSWDSPGKNTGVGCHFLLQYMKVKSESEVAQLCLTLSNPMGCSLPGFSIHGIFQARVLEWGAIASSVKLCTGVKTANPPIGSVSQSCPALCDPKDCSTPGFPVLHHLLQLAQTHVHWIGDAIQPFHLSSPSLPAFNLSASGSFLISTLFTSGGQSIGASALASVFPMNNFDTVHLLKAMVFLVIMYGCESWTIRKAERLRIDAFELWCLRNSWESLRF